MNTTKQGLQLMVAAATVVMMTVGMSPTAYAKSESVKKASVSAIEKTIVQEKAKAKAEDKGPSYSLSAKAIAKDKAEAKAEAKAKAKAEAKAEAKAKSKVKAEAKAKAEAKSKVKAEAKAKSKAEAEAKAKSKAEAKAKAKAEAKAKSKAKSKAEAKAKAKAEAKAKSKAEAKAKAKAEAKAKAKAKAEAKANVDAEKINKAENDNGGKKNSREKLRELREKLDEDNNQAGQSGSFSEAPVSLGARNLKLARKATFIDPNTPRGPELGVVESPVDPQHADNDISGTGLATPTFGGSGFDIPDYPPAGAPDPMEDFESEELQRNSPFVNEQEKYNDLIQGQDKAARQRANGTSGMPDMSFLSSIPDGKVHQSGEEGEIVIKDCSETKDPEQCEEDQKKRDKAYTDCIENGGSVADCAELALLAVSDSEDNSTQNGEVSGSEDEEQSLVNELLELWDNLTGNNTPTDDDTSSDNNGDDTSSGSDDEWVDVPPPPGSPPVLRPVFKAWDQGGEKVIGDSSSGLGSVTTHLDKRKNRSE